MTQGVARIASAVVSVTAKVVRSRSEFQQLGPEWTALFTRAGCSSVFLSFEWMAAWWDQWSRGRNLFVVAVRSSAGELVALAPLSIEQVSLWGVRQRRLCFLADRWVGSDYLGVLVRPDLEAAAIQSVVATIDAHRGEWDYLELSDADDLCPAFSLLRERLRGLGLVESCGLACICPYAPLPASFDEYLAGLSSNLRYNFRRRNRGLTRQGPTELVEWTTGPGLKAAFEELVRLHRMRFEQRGQESTFLNPKVQAFHAIVLESLARRNWVRLYLLRVGGEAVAALYGFSLGDRFLFYQSGMNPAWSGASVGLVLMGRTIERAIETGHKEYDFLQGDEEYKLQWTRRAHHTVTAFFADGRIRGLWARVVHSVKRRAAEAKRALRGGEAPTRRPS